MDNKLIISNACVMAGLYVTRAAG